VEDIATRELVTIGPDQAVEEAVRLMAKRQLDRILVVEGDRLVGIISGADISIRNISEGAAKDITFEFSAPVERSDGTVISDLAYFQDGLSFLAPGKEITLHWDHLDTLLPFLREKGLEGGIEVITRYKDLAGGSYKTSWNLDPSIYRDGNYVHYRGMGDLVDATGELVDAAREISARMDRAGRRDFTRIPPGGTLRTTPQLPYLAVHLLQRPSDNGLQPRPAMVGQVAGEQPRFFQ
jgi:CBS domain-containing protein